MSQTAKTTIKGVLTFVAVLASFFVAKSYYYLQISAVLIILLFILRTVSKKNTSLIPFLDTFDFTLIIFVTLTLIFKTGSASSPLLFLIYFLIFAVALLLDPISAILLSATTSFLFLITPYDNLMLEVIKTFSLFVVTPFALLFVSKYKKVEQDEARLASLEKEENEIKKWTENELREYLLTLGNNLDLISNDTTLDPLERARLTKLANSVDEILNKESQLEDNSLNSIPTSQ